MPFVDTYPGVASRSLVVVRPVGSKLINSWLPRSDGVLSCGRTAGSVMSREHRLPETNPDDREFAYGEKRRSGLGTDVGYASRNPLGCITPKPVI